jgi:hypothetical protein
MQLRSSIPEIMWAAARSLKTAAREHKEEITNWLGVLMLLAVGVVWL